MVEIRIDREKCKGCLLCVSICPKSLIKKNNELNRNGICPVEFKDNGSCSGCCICALICPDVCIEVFR